MNTQLPGDASDCEVPKPGSVVFKLPVDEKDMRRSHSFGTWSADMDDDMKVRHIPANESHADVTPSLAEHMESSLRDDPAPLSLAVGQQQDTTALPQGGDGDGVWVPSKTLSSRNSRGHEHPTMVTPPTEVSVVGVATDGLATKHDNMSMGDEDWVSAADCGARDGGGTNGGTTPGMGTKRGVEARREVHPPGGVRKVAFSVQNGVIGG
ncbi:unnamed protein product, partial [Discosporangium mesarthrocarpum]